MEHLNEILKINWRIIKSQKKCTQKLFEKDNIYYAQAPILHALKTLGECNQAEIAEFLATSPASVAVSLKRLSKFGLIKRQANKNDLRYNTVSLTEKGIQTANFAENTLFSITQQKLKGFSNEEIIAFIEYNKRMLENLNTFEKELNI